MVWATEVLGECIGFPFDGKELNESAENFIFVLYRFVRERRSRFARVTRRLLFGSRRRCTNVQSCIGVVRNVTGILIFFIIRCIEEGEGDPKGKRFGFVGQLYR
jgi:hypothetical protein